MNYEEYRDEVFKPSIKQISAWDVTGEAMVGALGAFALGIPKDVCDKTLETLFVDDPANESTIKNAYEHWAVGLTKENKEQ